MEPLLAVAFVVGLASTAHCLGMCGGIMGALSMSLPQPARDSRRTQLAYVSAYNLGRLSSYTVAGAFMGLAGAKLFWFLSPGYGHLVLQGLAALLLIAIGLYLAGWFPRFARIEHLGVPLWRRLEPLTRRLLPVRARWQAYAYGLVWGWLPCGLVYSALLWTAGAGDALSGALFMLAFGAGTLPSTLTAGMLGGSILRLARLAGVRRAIGIAVMAMGLVSFALAWNPHLLH